MTDPFEEVARQDKHLGPAITSVEAHLRGRLHGMRDGLRSLFDDNGQPLADSKAINAVIGALEGQAGAILADFRKDISKAADPIAREGADASRSLRETEARDPFAALGPSDLARASALRSLVSDLSDRLPPADLATRLRGIASENDRAAAAVYSAYAGGRLERERAKATEAGQTLSDPGIRELEDALKAVEQVALGKSEVDYRNRLRVIIGHSETLLTGLGAVRRKWDTEEIRQRYGIDLDKPRWKALFEAAGIEDSLSIPTPAS